MSRKKRRPRNPVLVEKRKSQPRQPAGPAVVLPALTEDGELAEELDDEQISWIKRAVACNYMSVEEAATFGVEPAEEKPEYIRPPEEDPTEDPTEDPIATEEPHSLFDE